MSEKEVSPEEMEAFRGEMREAIESTVFIIASGQDEGPFDIDPFSLGIGDESLSELSENKISVIREELYNLTGVTGESKAVNNYQAGDEGELSISVFKGTEVNDEGNEQSFFLHEIKHPNGSLDWQLSSSPEPLF